jgi:hypothetical protein
MVSSVPSQAAALLLQMLLASGCFKHRQPKILPKGLKHAQKCDC